MGFWDSQLADLEALGIRFDPLMERALEGEGEVLYLYTLLSPFSTPDYQEVCLDQNDEPVLVVERIEAYPPAEPTEFFNPQASPAQMLDENHGREWRNMPSVVGLLVECDRYAGWIYQWWSHAREETFAPYRFYRCYPLLDARIYEVLANACNQRLMDAHYYDVDELTAFENQDDYYIDIGSLWLYINEPHLLKDTERDYIQDWALHHRHSVMEPEENIRDILKVYEGCVEAEVVPPPWPEMAKNWEYRNLPFKPMEAYLQDEPLALEIWHILMAQYHYARARLTRHLTPAQRHVFDMHEEEFF